MLPINPGTVASGLLKEVSGYLDRQFVKDFLFPSILFWTGLLLVFTSPSGLENAISVWLEQSNILQIIQIIAGIIWLVFFAILLNNQQLGITRIFEGYWDWIPLGIGKFLRDLRKMYYQQVIQREDHQTIYFSYPPSKYSSTYLEYVMPTRLGNILRNAELYPYERYRIDAVLMWPRLMAVLPDSFTKSLADAKSSLDLMLIISFLSVLFALTSGTYLVIIGYSWLLFLICFLGGLTAARLAYLNALSAAISYGQLIKSAFDVFKGDLLQKMGYEKPESMDEEKKFWENLSQFVYRNYPQDPHSLRYSGSTGRTEKNSQGSFSISKFREWITHLIQKIATWFRVS